MRSGTASALRAPRRAREPHADRRLQRPQRRRVVGRRGGGGRRVDARPGPRAPARQHAGLAARPAATRWWCRAPGISAKRAARCRSSRSRRRAQLLRTPARAASRATSDGSTSSATRRTCACSRRSASAATSIASAITRTSSGSATPARRARPRCSRCSWEKWAPQRRRRGGRRRRRAHLVELPRPLRRRPLEVPRFPRAAASSRSRSCSPSRTATSSRIRPRVSPRACRCRRC